MFAISQTAHVGTVCPSPSRYLRGKGVTNLTCKAGWMDCPGPDVWSLSSWGTCPFKVLYLGLRCAGVPPPAAPHCGPAAAPPVDQLHSPDRLPPARRACVGAIFPLERVWVLDWIVREALAPSVCSLSVNFLFLHPTSFLLHLIDFVYFLLYLLHYHLSPLYHLPPPPPGFIWFLKTALFR